MKILHVIDVKNPNGNGVVEAVKNYIFYESKFNKVALYNLGSEFEMGFDNNVFLYKKYNKLNELPYGYAKPDIVIFNEVYKPKYLKLYKECLQSEIPYIIIPHGCLVKRAQMNKIFKKFFANVLFFNRFVKNSNALQFLNLKEQKNSIFRTKNNIVFGNGITISQKNNNPINKDIIYIGRYDVKVKGLDLLLKTVKKNYLWFVDNNVKIKLYGRKSNDKFDKFFNKIQNSKFKNVIQINGPIYNEDKKRILLESYAFIQVSRHEGQPMGILEALSYRLPCIVTFGTSFGEYINKNKCGIGIPFNQKKLFGAIKKIYLDEDFRNLCSKNAGIVDIDYDWESVIKKCVAKYENIIKL